VHALVAHDEAGRALAVGSLHLHGRVGLLRAGVVRPQERGRGLQRALIAARAALARELGCDMLTAFAAPDGLSERNLLQVGFERLAIRDVYEYQAAGS
jgi:N-acetylglutamate synthase-like GNAT family acetyltransferase